MVSEQAKKKALEMVMAAGCEIKGRNLAPFGPEDEPTNTFLYVLARVLQEHSDVAKRIYGYQESIGDFGRLSVESRCFLAKIGELAAPLILPDDELDVLEEIFAHQFGQNTVMREVSAKQLREGLDAAGWQIVRKDQ